MKKFIINENQFKVIKKHLNETINDMTYGREVNVEFEYYGTTYNGNQIDDISSSNKMRLSYIIEQENREWGIKNISLHSITGPDEIEITIYDDNEQENVITLPIDWDKLNTEDNEGKGLITVGDVITFVIENNENGDLVISTINLDIYTL
jgi:hypothetical protein